MPAPRERFIVIRKTLSAVAGAGAQGTVTIGTVTGAITINKMNVRCVTDLTGASATIALGVTGNTTALIAATTATTIDAGMSWLSTSPGGHQAGVVNRVIDADIIATVATADVTGGVLEFEIYYQPMSYDGLITYTNT